MNPDENIISQENVAETFGVSGEAAKKAIEGTAHLRNKPAEPAEPKRVPRTRPVVSQEQGTSDLPETKSAEQIQKEMLKQAQGELTALDSYYADKLAEQAVINEKRDRSTASISTLTGLAGSTEANVQQEATTKVGQQANEKIRNEKALAVQTLLGNIRRSSLEEARAQRQEARLDEEARIANRAARQQEAASQLTNLAAGGVTAEGLKNTDPQSYQYLVNQFGSEEALKGAFVLNTPIDQILDKRIEGGKYVIARQNPITGKINIETVDLGLPVGYSKTIDAGNRILAVPDNWDGDPANLVSISKGLTPSQQQTAGGTSTEAAQEALNGEYAGVINTAASIVGAEKGARSKQDIAAAIGSNDFGTAYALIANNVEDSLTGTSKSRFADARTDYQVMSGMRDAIAEYAAGGGDMGLLKGTAESISKKLGQLTTDPEFSTLATQLEREFQTYRNIMTGAAFTPAESREYEAVNPRANASLELNLATIDGALNQLENRVVSTINTRVPGAERIYQQVSGGATSGQDTVTVISPDGIEGTIPKENLQAALEQGYIQK